MHLEKGVGDTLNPLPIDVGIGKSHIGGFIAHRNGLPEDGGRAHTLMPVLESIHRNPSVLVNFDHARARRWPGLDQKGF